MPTPFAYQRDYALNAICPYFTMFPLEYPMRILKKHKKDNPVVVDPFCGRGTTIYAARRCGLRSYGFDISPTAVAIAKAKLAFSTPDKVVKLAEHFLTTEPRNVPTTDFFKRAFSSSALKDICAIREGLGRVRKETHESALLRAAMLGCLHGPIAQNLDRSGYFSNQMPRTFASKPDYSVTYWKGRKMKAPDVSVIKVLRRKLERIPDLHEMPIGDFRRIKCADARTAKPYEAFRGSLVVVTSPPYYGMRTYVQDQWLRNWFLGGPEKVDYVTDVQISHASHDDFVSDLARVWDQLKKRADDVHLYVRLGTIPSRKSDARELFHASLEKSGDWRMVHTQPAKTASEGKRQADQMQGESSAEDEFDFHAVAA